MLVYGLSSSGMSITVHYCMSDKVGWEITGNSSTSFCATCGMKKQGHKGCCHDEKKTVKSEKDQKNAEVFVYSLKAPVAFISSNYSIYSPVNVSNAVKELPYSHAPPYLYRVPQYIFNCVFKV